MTIATIETERLLLRPFHLGAPAGGTRLIEVAPLTVRGGRGEYWEPNVWMKHPAPAAD